MPVVAIGTDGDGGFARFAVRDGHLFPCNQSVNSGFHAFKFPIVIKEVVARRIRQEFRSRVDDRLVTAHSLARQFNVSQDVVFASHVTRNTLYVVRQANGRASGEGHRIMGQRVMNANCPFRVFRAVGTFVISRIQVDALRAYQFASAVVVSRRLVFHADFNSSMRRISSLLIITVRGICLRSFRARVKVVLRRLFRVPIRYVMTHPRSSSSVLKFTVVRRFQGVSF